MGESSQERKQEVKESKLAVEQEGEMSDDSVSGIPNGFECPITSEIMKDPVTAADGHSYENRAIKDWFERGNKLSPVTGEPLPNLDLKPNHNLRKAIGDWQEQQKKIAALLQQEAQKSEDLSQKVQLQQAELDRLKLDQKRNEAALMAAQGMAKQGVKQAQLALGQEVLAFVSAMSEQLKTLPAIAWDANAAPALVGAVISAIIKGSAAYNVMLEKPLEHSIQPPLAPFIKQYMQQHAQLWKLRDHMDFAAHLKKDLYQGNIAVIEKHFGASKPEQKDPGVMAAPVFMAVSHRG